MADRVVVTGAKRTPIGSFQGGLAAVTAVELGGVAIRSALDASRIPPDSVDEVHMGCVLAAGLGQAPARQASIAAGIPHRAPCTTINKMCGSGMKSVMLAHDSIAIGRRRIIAAGGMESMTNAPYLIPNMRGGKRMGHAAAVDHMFFDGLEDAYDKGRLMGAFAEDCAQEYQFTRQEQDAFATKSLSRALSAQQNGAFADEIETVSVPHRKQHISVDEDEQPKLVKADKIPQLRPAFRKGGTVTAANSSSISDGAAALVLASEDEAKRRDAPILARIVGQSAVATEPRLFTIAPILAARRLLQDLEWKSSEVDLWEVNEAFAVVAMAFMREHAVGRDRLNIRGGACALGHPIGASGARILVTLIHSLRTAGLRRGIAAVCIGGGEATAVAIECP